MKTETPETDALMDQIIKNDTITMVDAASYLCNKCRDLEKQRSQARIQAESWRAQFAALKSYSSTEFDRIIRHNQFPWE